MYLTRVEWVVDHFGLDLTQIDPFSLRYARKTIFFRCQYYLDLFTLSSFIPDYSWSPPPNV